jgi:aminocarboxymuconate-semialdehyde decarboxylase
MNAVDCHIHWFPPGYYELLSHRSSEPRTERAGEGWRYIRGARSFSLVPEWTSLETQLETAAATGMEMTVVSSMGIHSDLEGLPVAEAREGARLVNEAWADAQRRLPGRFFAAAAVPLIDTDAAIEELDHAIGTLGLRGVSMPGTVAGEPVDAERLEPFYARVAELDVPLFLHPTDGPLFEAMDGYGGAVYRSLGRVVDSSVAILRLVLSGLFDRHPSLRVLHFHAGGVLPFAAGRLDKNARLASLDRPPTAYLRDHMWVDTAMPYAPAIGMAIDFYGRDRMLYGSDNPCWNPLAALEATRSLRLSDDDMRAVMDENVRRLVDLRVPAEV